MIVDVNAFIGKWPYWPVPFTEPAEIVNALDGWGIDRAAVSSTRGIFTSWRDGNRETAQAAERHPQFIPFACLGPTEFTGALPRHDFFDTHEGSAFWGVRLYPQHHSYHPLFAPFVDRLCEDAASRRWPVLLPVRVIMNWGMPVLSLDWMISLVERHPRTPWILSGVNYLHELQAAVVLLRSNENVYLETSCIQGFKAIAKLVEQCGSERLLFGSGAPLQHATAAIAKILYSHISERDQELILGSNALRLLGLS